MPRCIKRPAYIRGKILYVPLTKGLVALASPRDRALVDSSNWCAHNAKTRSTLPYACRNDGKGGLEFLHRLILRAPPGVWVDHKNGNRLDNRRSNLRFATATENARNKNALHQNRTGLSSRFVGVSFDKGRPIPWAAYINVNGKRRCLGRFAKEIEAGIVRLQAELRYFGDFAPTQLPQ